MSKKEEKMVEHEDKYYEFSKRNSLTKNDYFSLFV